MLLPTADVMTQSRISITFHTDFNMWAIQSIEWGRLHGKNFLTNWYVNSPTYSRDVIVRVDRPQRYVVTRIKRFPDDWLIRSEWIGDGTNAPKSQTNVLHVPVEGMLISFKAFELLCVQTVCNQFIKVAVQDVLRVRTRMCRSCERRLEKRA